MTVDIPKKYMESGRQWNSLLKKFFLNMGRGLLNCNLITRENSPQNIGPKSWLCNSLAM